MVLPLKADTVRQRAHAALEDLPGGAKHALGDLLTHLTTLDTRVAEYDTRLREGARADARSRRLMTMPGIGPTTASALVAAIGSGHEFAGGRQLAAWLGLVPGQYSSGGKIRLGYITKAGDGYLRTLLILGARSVLASAHAKHKTDRLSRWAVSVQDRRGYGKALVAVAAKNARMAWAMLARGRRFDPWRRPNPRSRSHERGAGDDAGRVPLESCPARHAALSTAARDDVLDCGSSSRASVDNAAAVFISAARRWARRATIDGRNEEKRCRCCGRSGRSSKNRSRCQCLAGPLSLMSKVGPAREMPDYLEGCCMNPTNE